MEFKRREKSAESTFNPLTIMLFVINHLKLTQSWISQLFYIQDQTELKS